MSIKLPRLLDRNVILGMDDLFFFLFKLPLKMAISVSKSMLAVNDLHYHTKSLLDSDFLLLRALTWSFCSRNLNRLPPELLPVPQILLTFPI